MQVEWLGQSAFRLVAGDAAVVIDPFGPMDGLAARGMRFDYPLRGDLRADLLLVTHEHRDHNGVEAVAGSPHVVRSTAGTFDTPVGAVVAAASEHDDVAGTLRGPNVLFAFVLGGLRVAHLGDLGQRALREEQAAALGPVDVLFVPVGGGPTLDGARAAAVVERLGARICVPMHYRTARIDFLEPADDFLARMPAVERLDAPTFDTDALPGPSGGPLAVVPAAP